LDPNKPILVTGALGKTGSRVISALANRNIKVRAFIRRKDAVNQAKALGATEVACGDFSDDKSVRFAIEGCSRIIHICPPMDPRETEISKRITDHCLTSKTERMILYSVLHPLLQDVPHHNNKLAAERHLVNSGQNFTILQPSRYMQHLIPIWNKIIETGVHSMPFSIETKFSLVDLEDLAEATATIAIDNGHDGATYELAGPEKLSQIDMARILSGLTEKNIRAEAKPLKEFKAWAEINEIPAARIETMVAMNRHYDVHGLVGNPNVLSWILGRTPRTFEEFVKREILN